MSVPKTSEKNTEELLHDAALKVFAKSGFSGATVKEIADEAGVNISLISYHYKGKEGLYRACLERFGRARLEIAQKILQAPINREDFNAKLRLWMEQFLEAHLESPQMITIINREVMTDFNLVKDIFAATFLRSFHTLVEFFESAKKRGILKKNIDTEIFATIVFGSICHAGRTENIQLEFFSKSVRDPKYRAHLIEQMLGIVIMGVESNEK